MNNQPAFPSTHHNGWGEPEKGMTLRDYIAINATDKDIRPYLTNYSELVDGVQYSFVTKNFEPCKMPKRRTTEEARYMYADMMLKAREA